MKIAAVVSGDEVKSEHPLVAESREKVSQFASVHLRPWWEIMYSDALENGSIAAALASVFALLIATPDSEYDTVPLAELGNRVLVDGDKELGTQALDWLLSPTSSVDRRKDFASYLAAYRPDDCRFWLYHFSCVAKLIVAGRYSDASRLAEQTEIIQQTSPDYEKQIEDLVKALQKMLTAIWQRTYEQFSTKKEIATPVQTQLNCEDMPSDLLKLADEYLPPSPEAASLAIELSGDAWAGDRDAQFAEKLAQFRPADYPKLLIEWNKVMADLADKQIREAKLEIYACQNADEKLRFDMRHALRYVFSRERVIKPGRP